MLRASVFQAAVGAIAAAQSPPVPSDSPLPSREAGADSADSASERLRRLEETNRKPLERVEALSDENKRLSRDLKDLSSKVREPLVDGQKSVEGVKDSGLAGPGPVDRTETPRGQYGEDAWARSRSEGTSIRGETGWDSRPRTTNSS